MADDSWRTATFRQSVVSKIDEAIRQSRMPTSRNSMEMENHVFQKAKTREEYLGFVARLILHVREMNAKGHPGDLESFFDRLTNLKRNLETYADVVGPWSSERCQRILETYADVVGPLETYADVVGPWSFESHPRFHEKSSISANLSSEASSSSSCANDSTKRKREDDQESNVFEKASEVLPKMSKEVDEYDAFGIVLAAKLRQMDNHQRIYCEHVINEAIFKGMLGQLTQESVVKKQTQLK